MKYNQDKVAETVLALLYLNFFENNGIVKAWKSFDWDAMDHLFEKGYISNPKSKAKSVILTESGEKAAKGLFEKYFAV